jgi:hypothetical protein
LRGYNRNRRGKTGEGKPKTVNNYYNVLRETILKETLKEMPRDDGEFEPDEPYSGAKRENTALWTVKTRREGFREDR